MTTPIVVSVLSTDVVEFLDLATPKTRNTLKDKILDEILSAILEGMNSKETLDFIKEFRESLLLNRGSIIFEISPSLKDDTEIISIRQLSKNFEGEAQKMH